MDLYNDIACSVCRYFGVDRTKINKMLSYIRYIISDKNEIDCGSSFESFLVTILVLMFN